MGWHSVFDADRKRQSHGAGLDTTANFPLKSAVAFIPVWPANIMPLPSETLRQALIRRIAELPPNSHKRQALIGELQVMMRAIFSAGRP